MLFLQFPHFFAFAYCYLTFSSSIFFNSSTLFWYVFARRALFDFGNIVAKTPVVENHLGIRPLFPPSPIIQYLGIILLWVLYANIPESSVIPGGNLSVILVFVSYLFCRP